MKLISQIKYCLLFVACCYMVQGCNRTASQSSVPTYIHVDSFHFVADPLANTHITTHQVTEVWAYYNDVLIGAFDLPAVIPVITNGDTLGHLSLSPGIIVDGLNSMLGVYPFYKTDTFSFRPQPGKTISHTPITQYYSDAKFDEIDHFRYSPGASSSFALTGAGVPMEVANDPAMGQVGIINFTGATFDTLSDNLSKDSIIIPANTPAYIEFDYKSTVPFYVGLEAVIAGVTNDVPLSGIKPSADWKKFYLSVADFEAQYQASFYYFHLHVSLPAGQQSGTFEIANVQLVSF